MHSTHPLRTQAPAQARGAVRIITSLEKGKPFSVLCRSNQKEKRKVTKKSKKKNCGTRVKTMLTLTIVK